MVGSNPCMKFGLLLLFVAVVGIASCGHGGPGTDAHQEARRAPGELWGGDTRTAEERLVELGETGLGGDARPVADSAGPDATDVPDVPDVPDVCEIVLVCNPGTTSCKDGVVSVCDSSGASWQQVEECVAGEVCYKDVCCEPTCSGKQCGTDACGGSCGLCRPGTLCNEAGMCICVPQCDGKECGEDACGGTCGECQAGFACAEGVCLCVPQCDGKKCGDDACGGTCGECQAGLACAEGTCVCVPQCDGKECGDDACGGMCGECLAGFACAEGTCVCVPQCDGKECGDDACGGACGECGNLFACGASGLCEPTCVFEGGVLDDGPDGLPCCAELAAVSVCEALVDCGGGGPCCTQCSCSSVDVCTACGDGVCGPNENECNCLDCAKSVVADVCDGIDNDCDGEVDEYWPDFDGDGLADCVDADDDNDGVKDFEDCEPTDPAIHPGAVESCDGIDNDCDGIVDGAPADPLCEDDDPCTDDLCDFTFGGCRHLPKCAGCAGHVPPGAVVVTELMVTAEIPVFEWVELENVCDGPVELDGWIIEGDSTGSHTIDNCGPLTLHAGERVVLGKNMPATMGQPDNYNYDYFYAGVALREDSGVSLVAPDGVVIDHVPYGSPGFPKAASRSLSLNADATDSVLNDLPENWCVGVGQGAFGLLWDSIGKKNPVCMNTSVCGNKVKEPGEDCDLGEKNGKSSCDANCQSTAVCGNKWVEGMEECDDGNFSSGDCCNACNKTLCLCPYLPHCGDGVVQKADPDAGPPTDFECCDDGNNVYGDGCTPGCACEYQGTKYPLSPCGDGEIGPHEECDDGNLEGGDGCGPDCKWECSGGYALGQVIFTEFSPYPKNTISSWVELYNASELDIDLNGWFLGYAPSGHAYYIHKIYSQKQLLIKTGTYAILATDTNALAKVGINADYEYAGMWLPDSLRSPNGLLVDSFRAQPYPAVGQSLSLAPSASDYMSNDLKTNWCAGSVPMANGDFGTPGQPNPECP